MSYKYNRRVVYTRVTHAYPWLPWPSFAVAPGLMKMNAYCEYGCYCCHARARIAYQLTGLEWEFDRYTTHWESLHWHVVATFGNFGRSCRKERQRRLQWFDQVDIGNHVAVLFMLKAWWPCSSSIAILWFPIAFFAVALSHYRTEVYTGVKKRGCRKRRVKNDRLLWFPSLSTATNKWWSRWQRARLHCILNNQSKDNEMKWGDVPCRSHHRLETHICNAVEHNKMLSVHSVCLCLYWQICHGYLAMSGWVMWMFDYIIACPR